MRHHQPPSPTWKALLKNHVSELVSIDFFTVPTVGFKVLFVLLVLAHDRRRVVHFNVTENPTAHWTAQQMIEAFPWDSAPTYLLRDRDAIYGSAFHGASRAWASSRSSVHLTVLGRTRTSSA